MVLKVHLVTNNAPSNLYGVNNSKCIHGNLYDRICINANIRLPTYWCARFVFEHNMVFPMTLSLLGDFTMTHKEYFNDVVNFELKDRYEYVPSGIKLLLK